VNVRRDNAFTDRGCGHAAKVQVLADHRYELGQLFLDRPPGTRVSRDLQVLQVAGLEGKNRDLADETLELVVPRHEVGLGVDLDQRAARALGRGADQAFRGDPPGLLGGGGQAFLAQPVHRDFQVAGVFRQGLLAVHHAGAGLLAQLFHERSRDFGHITPLR
jgi:hypothetical protein